MAEVARLPQWTAENTREQFRAIARLRWLIFRNTLRRKGGTGDLVANLVMVPIFLLFLLGPAVAAGAISFYFTHEGNLALIAFVLWGIFVIAQLANIQLGKAETTFDPTQLIRFPLNFRGYTIVRVFFGLLAPSNIFATVTSFTVALGISIAAPSLALTAFAALVAFALANVFFTRMVFTWVDRWLATRRSREIFTALIFAFSLGIQYLNFAFNPGFHHGHHDTVATAARIATAQHAYALLKPVLDVLPPGLVVRALVFARGAQPLYTLLCIVGVLLFAAVFFAIFTMRLYKEFRGENISNQANAVAKPKPVKTTHTSAPSAAAVPSRFSPPSVFAGVLAKEFLTMRRNTGVFYGVVAPLVFVVIIVSKLATHTPVWIVFPAAVAYTMLGIAPLSFNSLGLEAAGIQFYFLAPIHWRDVFLAKNLMNLALAAVELIATFITVTVAARAPSPMLTLSVLLWTAFVLSITMTIGNHRSISAPKKLDPTKAANKQAGALSGLIAIGVLFGLSAVGAACLLATRFVGMPWLLVPLMLVLAVIGVVIYNASLKGLDKTVADNRDTLIEILCKAG